jgi:hypothetical protein
MNDQHKPQDWRQRLDEHESTLDPRAFWQDLEPRLPERQQRRRGLIWWWTAGLALALLAGGVWWAVSTSDTGNTVSDPGMTVRQDRKVAIPQPGADAPTMPDQERGDIQKAVSPAEQAEQSGRARFDAPLKGAIRSANKAKSAGPSMRTLPETADTPPHSDAQVTDIESWLQRKALPVAPERQEALAEKAESGTVGEDAQEAGSVGEEQEEPGMTEQPKLEGAVARPEEVVQAVPEQPRLRVAGWFLRLGFLAGAGLIRSGYSADEEVTQVAVAGRQATESNLEARSAALELRLYAPSGWFLHTGIQWNGLYQRFDRQWESTYDNWGMTTGTLIGADGQQSLFEAEAWQTRHRTRTVRHYNTVQTLDLPLALGYASQRGAWSADLALGLLFNLRQEAEGRSGDGLNGPAAWGSISALSYRRQLGLGGLAQGRVGWSPGRNLTVFLQPQWLWQSANRMSPEAGYSLRLPSLHLQTGVAIALR